MKGVLLLCLLSMPAWGQSVEVYSEFARIDDAGKVAAPETPREILSPALARNAFTSFQVVVLGKPDAHWKLYMGQNPERSVRVTMYRETGARLEPVELPYESQGTKIFWMDLWTERSAPVARIKVEPELFVNNDWIIYPMEARVMEAVVPDALPAMGMKRFLCGGPEEVASIDASTIAGLRLRNMRQDTALASQAPKEEIQQLFGRCDAEPPINPEWYFKVRDYLFRLR